MPRASTILSDPPPVMLMMTSARRIAGNAVIVSQICISIISAIPPKYPHRDPIMIPHTQPITTTISAMTKLVPAPSMTLEKTSRPKLSVPRICANEGGCIFSFAFMPVVL